MAGESDEVLAVSDARAQLTGILRRFRSAAASGDEAQAVVIGSHRRPEAVLVPVARFHELADSTRPRTPLLPELRRRRVVIDRLARANHIMRVRVFGSVARGSDGTSSDVDILVDPSDDATLFDLAQFEMDLEALLERPVDVVSSRSLDPGRDARILDEAVSL
jgi:uncharacterized protein